VPVPDGVEPLQSPDCSRADLDEDDVQAMTVNRRLSIVNQKSSYQEMLNDEVYVSAGHKGNPTAEKGRQGRRNRLKGSGSGTLKRKAANIWDDSTGRRGRDRMLPM